MPLIIEEVTADAVKPAAPPEPAQPVIEAPGDTERQAREILAMMRRREARAERLRAD